MQLVELVKLGFAGFVAAMALLSYQLMKSELARATRNAKVFEQIHAFARYTLVLALVVLVGTIVDGASKWVMKREDTRLDALGTNALTCRQALTGLKGTEGRRETVVELRQVQERAYDACFAALRMMQGLALKDEEP